MYLPDLFHCNIDWAVCQLMLVVYVVEWRGSWGLLQTLGLAVNLSSETLSYESLKIAEMLKKRRGGVQWGLQHPEQYVKHKERHTSTPFFSNVFFTIFLFILPLTHFFLFLHHILLFWLNVFLFASHLTLFLSICTSHSPVSSLHPHCLSTPSLPALLRPWGTIRLHWLTLV